MKVIEALVSALRLPELRNKIIFTGAILVIVRVFANVAVPGASQVALSQLFNSQALLGLFCLFSGGALMVGAIARTDLFGPHRAVHLALEADLDLADRVVLGGGEGDG